MSKYLYEVCLSTGTSHPEFKKFHDNVNNLKAQAPSFSGIINMCILAHHMDLRTVRLLCSEGIDAKNDITVKEITRDTLNDEQSSHRMHTDLVNNYFLPYDDYPNIK
ncbi:hypothetical protein [Photobacterium leiognathi]|uniref:hypothetical protein n=1 Tax=Photobacterium leiognathi TaxID=553611 RepID=UPI0027389325|nr:hypothetical protein [Photobacterium leiognathi]